MDAPADCIGTLADGRYRLEGILGQGGMAVVYSAWDARLHVRRAVKILNPELASKEVLRERFEREARVMARLHHPHILTVHDVGVDGRKVYIIMELMEGGSLAGLIRPNLGIEPTAALGYVLQVLEALRFAHDEGVIHRDVKPENVLLDRRGQAKVNDFGIARVRETDHALTKTGAVLGTWAYMAPEVRFDGTAAGVTSDLYAVGAMVFACVTGRPPLDLYATNLHTVHFEGMAGPLQALIQRATAYQPEDRYASAGEMAAQVEAVRRALGAAAKEGDARVRLEDRPLVEPIITPPAPRTDTFSLEESAPAEPAAAAGPVAEVAPVPAPPNPAPVAVAFDALSMGQEPPRGHAVSATIAPPEPPAPPDTGGTLSEGSAVWEPRSNRLRRRWLAATAIAIAAVPVAIWLWPRGEPDPAPTPPQGSAEVEPEVSSTYPPLPEPEPEDEVAPLPTVAEPAIQEAPAAPPPEAPRERSARRTGSPVPAEDVAVPEPTPTVVVPQAPVIVHLRLTSDPLGSTIRIDGQPYPTPADVSLPVGAHHFEFDGGGWSTSCDQAITEGASKLKFSQGKQGCVVF